MRSILFRYCVVLFLVSILGSCTAGPYSLSDHQYASLTEGMPPAWNDSDVVVLRDSLRIVFQERSGGNRASVQSIKWIKVNATNGQRIDPFLFASSDYTQDSPSLWLSWYSPRTRHGGFYTTDLFRREDNYYQGVYASGSKVYIGNLPIYEPGMIIRYSYVFEQKHPEFLSQFPVQGSLPVVRSHVQLTVPKSARAFHVWKGVREIAGRESVDSSGSRMIWSWELESRVPYAPGGNYKEEEWAPALHVSLPPFGSQVLDWKELGDDYLSKIDQEKGANDHAILAIAKGKTPQQIMDFLRAKIRYHADNRGENAIFPRSTDTTLHNGYGDCKGMSLLLAQLLRSAGYKAHLVVVTSSEDTPQPLADFPSLGRFDHMIVALEQTAGTLVFLDPTNSWSRWDETAWYMAGQMCLVLEKGNSRYVNVVLPSTARAEVKTVNLIIDGEHPQIKSNMVFLGAPSYALHGELASLNASERSVVLREFLRRQYNVEASSVRIKADTVGYLSLEFSAPLGNSWVQLQEPSLRLDRPSITLPQLGRKNGPGWLRIRPLTQEDRWILPDGKRAHLAQPEMKNDLGTASWVCDSVSITRRFERNPQARVNTSEAKDHILHFQGVSARIIL